MARHEQQPSLSPQQYLEELKDSDVLIGPNPIDEVLTEQTGEFADIIHAQRDNVTILGIKAA